MNPLKLMVEKGIIFKNICDFRLFCRLGINCLEIFIKLHSIMSYWGIIINPHLL